MDLHSIHKKTQLPLRTLRYVLDHSILPGLSVEPDTSRAGHPRSFTEFEGFCIACSAALLVGGVRRELVAKLWARNIVWDGGSGVERPKITALEKAFRPGTVATAVLADGRYLAFWVGAHKTKWIDLDEDRGPPKFYSPRASILLDLGLIRDDIRQS